MSNPIERKQMWLDAFKNKLENPVLDIEKTVETLEDYEIERALKEDLESKELNTKLEKRQRKLNKNFVWTPKKIEKLRDFNDKMWFRYKEAYDEVCRLKKEFDERFANGDMNYASYDIRIEFWYSTEDGLSEKEEKLWEDLCDESVFWGPSFAQNLDSPLSTLLKKKCWKIVSPGMSIRSTHRSLTGSAFIILCMTFSTIITLIRWKI